MLRSPLLLSVALVLASACYQPERDCEAFKTGSFTFTADIDGRERTTTFIRYEDREIDRFEGRSDTSSVRWINSCEYVVKKLNPRNRSEERAIHMKILSTTDDSYTFEYRIVGSSNTSRGTAYKTP